MALAEIYAATAPPPRFTPLRIAALVLQCVWVAVLWAIFIAKVNVEGIVEFSRYLTNWTWMLNTLFWSVDLFAGYALPRSVFVYWSSFGIWVVSGVNWIVFWMLFYLLDSNPGQITDNVVVFGISLGLVMNGDRLFHIVPTLYTNSWILMRHRELHDAYAWFMLVCRMRQWRWWSDARLYVLLWLVAGVAAPLVFIAIWRSIFDPVVVYALTRFNSFLAIAIALAVALVFTGISLLLVVTAYGGAATRRHESFYTYLRDDTRVVVNLLWLLTLIMVTLLWGVQLGAVSFVSHFEMWFFTVSILYYVNLMCLSRNKTHRLITWTLSWSLFTLTWLVFWLSTLAYFGEATRIIDVDGDSVFDGVDFAVDRIIKIVPVVMMFATISLHSDILLCQWPALVRSRRAFFAYALVGALVVPMVVCVTYRAMFDPCVVYANVTADYAWLLWYFFVAIVFGVGTQLLVLVDTLRSFTTNLKEAHHVELMSAG